MDLDGLGNNFCKAIPLSVLLFYTFLKAISPFDELAVTPPTVHLWITDLKTSSFIHAYIIKD